jgi:hypothetical protein
MFARVATGLGVALALVGGPAPAKELAFRAVLSGEHEPTKTGSMASAQAVILVDTDRRTVDVRLYVNGLTVDQLSNGLRGAPMGPIHLHIYGGHDHNHAADAALVFPVPYGPSYSSGEDSFQVETGAVDYVKGAALVNTNASFEDFVSSMRSGRIVLNVHTNRFADGEISGDVTPG